MGFLATAVCWFSWAYFQSAQGDHLLTDKLAQVFSPGLSALSLALIAGALGGLVNGLASSSGLALRQIFVKSE